MVKYRFNKIIYSNLNELLDVVAEKIDINKIVKVDKENFKNDILDDIKDKIEPLIDGEIFEEYGLKIECFEDDNEDSFYNFNGKSYLDIDNLFDDIEREIDIREIMSLRLQDENYRNDILKETLHIIKNEMEIFPGGEIFEGYGVKIECFEDDPLDDSENEIDDIEYELKSLINLSDAKELAIGERFIFRDYQGEPIEWRKINENLAISEKILDCIIFDKNLRPASRPTYDKSKLRKWCNEILGKSLGLLENTIYELSEKEMLNYFPTDESRRAKPTEVAIMHGIYVDTKGYSPYWTSSLAKKKCSTVWYRHCPRIVHSWGELDVTNTDTSGVGVRPALKLN